MICKTWKWILFLLLLAAVPLSYPAQNAADKIITAPLRSLTFHPLNVLQARESIKRAGWEENVIDAHYSSKPSEAEQTWILAVKAALLGGEERLQKALKSWQTQVENQSKSTAQLSPDNSFLLLQTCDCLLVTPEVRSATGNYLNEIKKTKKQLTQHILENKDSAGEKPAAGNDLLLESLRLYASLMSDSVGEGLSSAITENYGQKLLASARNQIAGEGLLPGSGESQIKTALHLLVAATALQTVSPETLLSFKPFVQKPIDLLADLAYPDGSLPASYGQSISLDLLETVLERGYALFQNPQYQAVLNHLYKNRPRKGEALLYGVPALESKKTFLPRTSAFPQAGFAILRNEDAKNPLSVFIDTGISRIGKDSALLGIEVKSGQNQITGTANQPGTGNFNTVLVDQASQLPAAPDQNVNALIYSLRTLRDGCAYLNAAAEGQYSERKAYPVSTYQRSLYLSSSLLFDVFRVRGGKTHDYQYTYNGIVDSVTGVNVGNWKQSTPVKGVYGIQLKPAAESGTGERLWFIDPAGSSLKIQDNRDQNTISATRTMEEDEADLFAVVHDYGILSATSTINVSRIAFTPGGNRRDFQICGIAIEHNDDTDVFISSTNPDTEYSADYLGKKLVFQGIWGHIALKKGQFSALRLGGGTKLRFGEYGVAPKEAMITGISRTVDPTGTVELDFGRILPEDDACFGHSFLAISANPMPVMFQSLVMKSISIFESSQKVVLQNHPSLDHVNPLMGFDFLPGTQLIYESCTELRRVDENNFTLALNTPAEFMIEGSEDFSEIHYRLPNGRNQITGDFKVGTIQAKFSPEDAARGYVRFERTGWPKKKN